jgi:transposase
VAAAGRSTRSIAKEVGVQPRIVSLWRHRIADHGLEGLNDKPRPGKTPIYTKSTDRRILALLDKPPPKGFGRWTGPLLAEALGDVDVQYVWRFLRRHRIDLVARKSWCESNDPAFTSKAADVVGLYIAPPAKAIVPRDIKQDETAASTSYRITSMHSSAPTTTKPSRSSGTRKKSAKNASKAGVSLSFDSGY